MLCYICVHTHKTESHKHENQRTRNWCENRNLIQINFYMQVIVDSALDKKTQWDDDDGLIFYHTFTWKSKQNRSTSQLCMQQAETIISVTTTED